MSFVPVEHAGCRGCSAASRIRPESLCTKRVFEEPEENGLGFEALLQGNFAMESLGFPTAAKKEREDQALTFGMEIVSKYLSPFQMGDP